MENIILIFHVLAALGIIGLVLMQQGKGADMGSGFGGGSSNTVFGSGGAGNFLTRTTTTIAIVFFATSFALAYFAKERSDSVADLGIPQQAQEALISSDELELPDLAIPETDEDSEVPQL
ncbi:MAG: preprotein translocase subunit SecG [Gammaproteobacteria bacterium]|nr:preprotein translocase subunit SecG [Gammaproteobacteria bacterium]